MLEEQLKQIIKQKRIDNYTIDPTDNYFDHITFSVNCLSDYIKIMESINSVKKYSNYFFFYRGISNCS
jgi:hypothetical protein